MSKNKKNGTSSPDGGMKEGGSLFAEDDVKIIVACRNLICGGGGLGDIHLIDLETSKSQFFDFEFEQKTA